ncbi:TetR/AcrR family transcriptional regulator [Rhodococcus sp. UNC23MFCrub1.1]|uniref:TetR/AcrR family transcriptional regulator n=1 Tax=Rhodococcus sp. UNC23MFCrub1.1 TaxID=1449068 RepID=UPI0018CC77D8|nr:TetR/AcrR family transcriptional regulator [Rhodococcus sp. UNC23MFCrub1.1]
MAALRESGPSARDRIITAAVRSLSELTPALMLSAVGTRAIARRAGVSTALVFHHFGSVETLAVEVVDRIFDPGTVPAGEVGATIDALAESALPVDAAVALHHNEFLRVTGDPELRLRLGVWALGGPTADAAYQQYLAAIDARLEPMLAKLLHSWGRELRPPWTPSTYIAAHSSLLSGSVTRHLIDPDRGDIDSFARAAASMSMISMRVIGDRHTVEDRLSEINYYPLRRGRRAITEISERKHAVLLHTAAEQFGTRGFAVTKMSQIARAAKVSESTLYSHFVSKAALAAELFDKQAADGVLRGGTGHDQGADQPDSLERAVRALVTAAATRTDIAPPYLAELVDPTSRRAPQTVITALAKLLNDGHRDHDDRMEEATMIIIATIRRTLRFPSHTARMVAAHVLRERVRTSPEQTHRS